MQKNQLISKTSSSSIGTRNCRTLICHDIEMPLTASASRRSVTQHLLKPPSVVGDTRKTSMSKNKPKSNNLDQISKPLRSLHTPQLNSMHHLLNNMEQLNLNSNSKIDLTPKSKAIMVQQVTKKLNFPYDKPVYTDLVPIEDDNMTPDYSAIKSNRKLIREKYINSQKKTDPEPELKDFLSPMKKIEIDFPLYTRQCSTKPPNIDPFDIVSKIVTDHPSWNSCRSTISLD